MIERGTQKSCEDVEYMYLYVLVLSCTVDGFEGEAERVMSRAVDVGGGTECKRSKEIVRLLIR